MISDCRASLARVGCGVSNSLFAGCFCIAEKLPRYKMPSRDMVKQMYCFPTDKFWKDAPSQEFAVNICGKMKLSSKLIFCAFKMFPVYNKTRSRRCQIPIVWTGS